MVIAVSHVISTLQCNRPGRTRTCSPRFWSSLLATPALQRLLIFNDLALGHQRRRCWTTPALALILALGHLFRRTKPTDPLPLFRLRSTSVPIWQDSVDRCCYSRACLCSTAVAVSGQTSSPSKPPTLRQSRRRPSLRNRTNPVQAGQTHCLSVPYHKALTPTSPALRISAPPLSTKRNNAHPLR